MWVPDQAVKRARHARDLPATPQEEVPVTRLVRMARDTLGREAAELFDHIAGGERATQTPRFSIVGADGALDGPFNAMLLSPRLGMAVQALGAQVRYHSTLTDRCREIAILTVAARWDSAYERYAHEDVGRAVGLTEEEIATIAAGHVLAAGDPVEALTSATAHALARDNDLTDEQYEASIAALGERGLFELVVLVGYYTQLALILRVFRVVPPTTAPIARLDAPAP